MFTIDSISKFLFFDVETVSQYPSFRELTSQNFRLSILWSKRCSYYRQAFPDLKDMDDSEIYLQKSPLEPEFSKIICVSFGYFTEDGEMKFVSFFGIDELDILSKSNKIFKNAISKGWKLCGHNIKGFDVPCLGKRMVFNGINPSANLQIWDKKPWEIPFVDTSDIFAFGSWSQQKYLSLDLLACSLGIDSPKGDLDGSKVNSAFWEKSNFDQIKTYCEADVRTAMLVMKKICF